MTKRTFNTPKQIDNLIPEATAYEVSDAGSPGLRIRVEPTGRKTFRWLYREGGKRRVKSFGTYDTAKSTDITLADARKAIEKAKDRLHDGGTLAPASNAPKTVKELADVFYERRIKPHRKRPDAVRAVMNYDVVPSLGTMRLPSVSPGAITSMIDKVVDRGATTHAGKILAITKQMFRFAVSRGYLDTSPAESLDPLNHGVESNVRDRTLALDEIPNFWRALDRAPRMSPPVRLALKVLLLTGVRSGELRLATWADIDWRKLTWTIPVKNQKLSPAQAKKAKPFIVPLTPMVAGLFRELEKFKIDKTEFIVAGRTDGPLTDKVLGRAVRRLFEIKLDGEPLLNIPLFSPHDLRRTLRTHLGESLKTPPHIAERCLNHSLGRIVQTYDTGDYLDERREALERWSEMVGRQVYPIDNVVEIR